MAGGTQEDDGFFTPVLGDGRPLLFAMAGSLVFAGGFLFFLAATGDLLPHDVDYLGMTAEDLEGFADGRIVDFMIHDRVAFAGTLVGLGVMYTWLTAFPLAAGEAWAWFTWLISGTVGFLSFLGYLGYGYLDTWHGVGTVLLLPVFVLGLVRTRRLVDGPLSPRAILSPGPWLTRGPATLGRGVLVLGAAAIAAGGLVILRVGVGDTFVPEDLEFIGLTADQLDRVNPRLVPLLAHDRAGFGGGVVTLGLTTLLCLWCAGLSRHLRQAVLLAGVPSAGGALVIHFLVGYTDVWHLLPAVVAASSLVVGLTLETFGRVSGDSGATRS